MTRFGHLDMCEHASVLFIKGTGRTLTDVQLSVGGHDCSRIPATPSTLAIVLVSGARRPSPPDYVQNRRCSGGLMPLVSTLARDMVSAFQW